MLARGQAPGAPGGVAWSASSSFRGCVESACEHMVQTGLSTVKHASRRRAAVVGVMVMVLRSYCHRCRHVEVVCAAAHLSEEPILAGQQICLLPWYPILPPNGEAAPAARLSPCDRQFEED
jgi:hypothetical protein